MSSVRPSPMIEGKTREEIGGSSTLSTTSLQERRCVARRDAPNFPSTMTITVCIKVILVLGSRDRHDSDPQGEPCSLTFYLSVDHPPMASDDDVQ